MCLKKKSKLLSQFGAEILELKKKKQAFILNILGS